jgi:hypothetical protein
MTGGRHSGTQCGAEVEAAVRRHPKARRYRVGVKRDRIVVYEIVGPDAERRAFRAGWWCYLGSIDDWIDMRG